MKFVSQKVLYVLTTALLYLFIILIMSMACEPAAQLRVINQTDTTLTIINAALDQNGELMHSVVLGEAFADSESIMQYVTLIRNAAGWTVRLKAKDSLGEIVWQRDWLFEEFLKLKNVGWKITISPETNQLPSK